MTILPYNPYRKPLMVMSGVTWFVWLGMVLIVQPAFVQNVLWHDSYLPFFILFFFGLLWLSWSLTGRWKRSLLWTAIVTSALWLQLNQLLFLINAGLLLCFGIVWEYYWHLSKSSKHFN